MQLRERDDVSTGLERRHRVGVFQAMLGGVAMGALALGQVIYMAGAALWD